RPFRQRIPKPVCRRRNGQSGGLKCGCVTDRGACSAGNTFTSPKPRQITSASVPWGEMMLRTTCERCARHAIGSGTTNEQHPAIDEVAARGRLFRLALRNVVRLHEAQEGSARIR